MPARNRSTLTRRVVTAAAIGGGGIGAVTALGGAALFGLLIGQSKLARRRIPQAFGEPPFTHDTTWTAPVVPDDAKSAAPIRLAVFGDSLAAGYGVQSAEQTTAARLALGISVAAARPVHVTNLSIVGAESVLLEAQLAELGDRTVDVAVIIIGANDVTHRIKTADSIRYLETTVRELRSRGIEVVVGTCPDLGTIRPLAQPLRSYARRLSRAMAAAQTAAVERAGGRTVSLGLLLGPLFSSTPTMFGDDQFHPSASGYAAAAAAMLPACLDALQLADASSAA